MVRLTFTEYAPAPLAKVWQYFSKFQNIADWQPNTRKITPQSSQTETVGSTYKLITLWKGQQSQLDYQIRQIEPSKKFVAHGQNSTTYVIDEIHFQEKGTGTEITYIADISLKHVLKIMTPCIKADLNRLSEEAQQGMKKKIKQLYG